MNVILAILGVAMIGVLIDVAYLIHKELQDSESYHERRDKINQLHEDNLSTTRGVKK